LALVAAVWTLTARQAAAEDDMPAGPAANAYAYPGSPGGVTAALYPCPRPVPPYVGYTYIPYQPLAPHEFLNVHHNHWVTFHEDGTRTRTTACYWHRPVLWPFTPSHMWSLPRGNRPPASASFMQ
jgi:hypothetical protein